MRFDLSEFHKSHSSKTHTTLRHKDGHEIKIVHSKLEKEHLDDLEKLPVRRMRDGGEVAPTREQLEMDPPLESSNDLTSLAMPVKPVGKPAESKAPEASNDTSSMQEANKAELSPESQQQPQPQPDSGVDTLSGPGGLPNQMRTGLAEQAQAEGQQGKEEAGILEQAQKDLQAHQEHYVAAQRKIEKPLAELKHSILTEKIDPNQFIEHRGTLANIMTGIGLVLGGAGAGVTGGPNLAAQFLEKQIDADIKAQMHTFEQKNNMLNFAMKEMGNLRDAHEFTKLMMMQGVATKLQQAAAKSKDPQAQARALQLGAEWEAKMLPYKQQLETRQALQSSLKSGGKPDPAQMIEAMSTNEHQKTKAREELSTLQNFEGTAKLINKSYKDAQKLTAGWSALPATQQNARLKTMNASLIQSARKAMKGQGSLSDQEVEDAITPYLIDQSDLVNKDRLPIKQQQFLGWLQQQAAGTGKTLEGMRIPYKPNLTAEPIQKRD